MSAALVVTLCVGAEPADAPVLRAPQAPVTEPSTQVPAEALPSSPPRSSSQDWAVAGFRF